MLVDRDLVGDGLSEITIEQISHTDEEDEGVRHLKPDCRSSVNGERLSHQ